MLTIAVVLTLAADDVFAWLFLWAGSAAGVRLSGPANAKAVTAITALAAATLALASPEGGLVLGHHGRGVRRRARCGC